MKPPCSPSTTNDDCISAITLTSGSGCTKGTLCGSGMEATEESVIGTTTIMESVWYTFQATDASMYIDMNQLTGTCYIAVAIYGTFASSTGGCMPVLASRIAYISASSAPIQKIINTNGLTIGQWYMIQVGTDGSCGVNGTATFCISVSTPLNCSTCTSPCGATKGYTVAPSSYTQLQSDGACYPMRAPNDTIEKCYTFTSWDDSVSFSAGWYATGGCGGFTTKQFSLYDATCLSVSVNSTGSFTTLTIGNVYTICYFLIMSSSCNIDTLCPYYIQSKITNLPVKLLDFTAELDGEKIICKWSTASETNNDYYTVERSTDGTTFLPVAKVEGAGNSSIILNYSAFDNNPILGIAYYRLKQTDYDGQFSFSKIVSVNYTRKYYVSIFPNPFNSKITVIFERNIKGKVGIEIEDILGQIVYSNIFDLEFPSASIEFDLSFLKEGMYLANLIKGVTIHQYKIIKS